MLLYLHKVRDDKLHWAGNSLEAASTEIFGSQNNFLALTVALELMLSFLSKYLILIYGP